MKSDADRKERALLEIEFAKNLDQVIGELLDSQFSSEDIDSFVKAVKTFLKFDDLRHFVTDILYDRVSEISKLMAFQDAERFFSLRKMIGIILDLGDDDLIDSLETYLACDHKFDHFFIFLEEKVKRGIDTSRSEKVFIELSLPDLAVINRFLKIVNKDESYIIREMMNPKIIANKKQNLHIYISVLIKDNPYNIEKYIVPTLVAHYNADLRNYMELIKDIIAETPKFTNELLNDGYHKCFSQFFAHIIAYYTDHTELVKNFCLYLKEYHTGTFEEFENLFVLMANSHSILTYSINVPFSTKRKVLRQLVELKDEKSLVEFIKNFPEYKSLLPML